MRPVSSRSLLLTLAVFGFVACGAASPAMAKETAAPAPAPASVKETQPPAAPQTKNRMETLANHNPDAAKLMTMAHDLYNTMPHAELSRLVRVRTGATMIGVAKLAIDDIGKTVALCDKANPTLKGALDPHFDSFKKTITPEIAAQEKAMQTAVEAKGNFTHPDQVTALLHQLYKTMVSARAENDKALIRVTSADACKALGASMDKNAQAIVDALRKVEWSAASADKGQ
jgi:hypothetical protein